LRLIKQKGGEKGERWSPRAKVEEHVASCIRCGWGGKKKGGGGGGKQNGGVSLTLARSAQSLLKKKKGKNKGGGKEGGEGERQKVAC